MRSSRFGRRPAKDGAYNIRNYVETMSGMALLRGWQLLMGADRHRTKELRGEARRCFRLAQSTVGLGLAAELEAIGREFENEADDLSARMQAAAYQICDRGLDRQRQASCCLQKLGKPFRANAQN